MRIRLILSKVTTSFLASKEIRRETRNLEIDKMSNVQIYVCISNGLILRVVARLESHRCEVEYERRMEADVLAWSEAALVWVPRRDGNEC